MLQVREYIIKEYIIKEYIIQVLCVTCFFVLFFFSTQVHLFATYFLRLLHLNWMMKREHEGKGGLWLMIKEYDKNTILCLNNIPSLFSMVQLVKTAFVHLPDTNMSIEWT